MTAARQPADALIYLVGTDSTRWGGDPEVTRLPDGKSDGALRLAKMMGENEMEQDRRTQLIYLGFDGLIQRCMTLEDENRRLMQCLSATNEKRTQDMRVIRAMIKKLEEK